MLDPHLMAELAAEIQKERIETAQRYMRAEPAEPFLPILKARVATFMQRFQRPEIPAAHKTQEIPAAR